MGHWHRPTVGLRDVVTIHWKAEKYATGPQVDFLSYESYSSEQVTPVSLTLAHVTSCTRVIRCNRAPLGSCSNGAACQCDCAPWEHWLRCCCAGILSRFSPRRTVFNTRAARMPPPLSSCWCHNQPHITSPQFFSSHRHPASDPRLASPVNHTNAIFIPS